MALSRLIPRIFQSHVLRPWILTRQDLHVSPANLAVPGKRRKKVDPALERAREDKRIKKLNKALRKMERKDRILRPLLELEVSPQLLKEQKQRQRGQIQVTEEENDRRERLAKDWNRFCGQRHKKEIQNLDKNLISQQLALDELRAESLQLYQAAVQIDESLLPFKAEGPTRTPPIPNYIQDGEYEDVTKSFQVQYPDMKEFLKQITMSSRVMKKKMERAKEQEE